ncbi:hypothetical protein CMV_025565 [Castanea mollissima]|uniref:Uncharacterized protein n=1 Tax=Castanea mollissima TaxID=60419 RepID=A0A8J4QLD7_9ROSI|nr:hypothetical protein CMV_025565 [Castanea mollissima]
MSLLSCNCHLVGTRNLQKAWGKHGSELPTLQIAFQYTVVVPPAELSNSELGSATRAKHSLKRRLRIRTLQFGAAQNVNELYDSVDPEVVLSLLVHKSVVFSNKLNLLIVFGPAAILVQKLTDKSAWVFFLSLVGITPWAERLGYATDALEPSSLHRAVYPVLMSYSTPDKQAYPRHSLSRAALITSGSPIFFLDAFTTLVVFYSSTADPALPYPPPHDCLLRTSINKLKQDRCITPKLIFIRGGQDDATVFENYLIEEQDVDGSGLTSVMGFVSFLEDISRGVLEYLK